MLIPPGPPRAKMEEIEGMTLPLTGLTVRRAVMIATDNEEAIITTVLERNGLLSQFARVLVCEWRIVCWSYDFGLQRSTLYLQ